MPLGQFKDCRITTRGEEYVVTFYIIKMHTSKDSFPILLRWTWLRMANAVVNWKGIKPSITYGPDSNRLKVPIGYLASVEVKKCRVQIATGMSVVKKRQMGN